MRAPQWFPDIQKLTNLLPSLSRLQRESVTFASHYTASNMCTPSRGVMTTGLYSHQTGCLFTGEGPSESSLAPQFPTWGTMLRQQGYRTWWWGKWHLGDWSDTNPEGLDAHGFSGGTFPSPNGAPNQGLQKDPGRGPGAPRCHWSIRTTSAGGRETLFRKMFRTGSITSPPIFRRPMSCVSIASRSCRSTTPISCRRS
ncbi:Sulfatase family protein [Mycobacteroides abscessus subsp. massiliense]|nr:Sulfatase family protein [Mycobacteroides abscessus subsp. massiliense]